MAIFNSYVSLPEGIPCQSQKVKMTRRCDASPKQDLSWQETDLKISHQYIPSGKNTKSYWKWPFIVSLPIENGDFP
jgi:hypothetical protein